MIPGKVGLISFLMLSVSFFSLKATDLQIVNLKTEYTQTPLGIDVEKPRFSWQMESEERGISQTGYRIVVMDEKGGTVWDTGKVDSDISLNIYYSGSPLQPRIRYNWEVTVWSNKRKKGSGTSWFETGLMNADPALSGWSGAKWIGGSGDDMVLYAPYLPVFKVNYSIRLDEKSKSTKAAFVFGANDMRLMNRYKNLYYLENKRDSSYLAVELDISSLESGSGGNALLHIYRVGYHPSDKKDTPFKSFPLPKSIINETNKYNPHRIYLSSLYGYAHIYIGEEKEDNLVGEINLNPMGQGGDFITFPVVGDIGFAVSQGQQAYFSNIEIRNYRNPSNLLFTEDLGEVLDYQGIFSKKRGVDIENSSYKVSARNSNLLVTADPSRNAMPMLRTIFTADKGEISKARLYVTSRGIYDLYVNGERIGDDYFNPGLTQYTKTHLYQTFDLTGQIHSGKNVMGAILGEGWWSGGATYSGSNWNFFGDRQSLLAKLVITYSDGKEEVIVTNPSIWKYFNNGPVTYGSFFQGEVYDARKEKLVEGWSRTNFDDSSWKKSVEIPLEGSINMDQVPESSTTPAVNDYSAMKLIGQLGETVRKITELTAVDVAEVRPGVFVYDMGQNMAGVPEIQLTDMEPGRRILLRFAEVKYPDLPEYKEHTGMMMLENIRAAMAQDIYIARGGYETITPRFTFHGYRFVEITGIEKPLPLSSVKAVVLSSIHELASKYETSDPKINKLWGNITWSTYSNFFSIPTDCPQRNERMGWSGDISVFSRASTYLANTAQFLRRHMLGMRDTQREDGRFPDVAPLGGGFGGILWGSAGITVAWESYQQYNDKVLLAEHYSAMKEYMDYLTRQIDPETHIMGNQFRSNWSSLGDWLSPEHDKNEKSLLWEAYFLYDLKLMGKIALELGKQEDAAFFNELYQQRKAFFNNSYIDKRTAKTKFPDSGKIVDSQVSYVLPLAFNLVEEQYREKFTENFLHTIQRENRADNGTVCPPYSLMTGFIGTAWITKALSDCGYPDAAYELLHQNEYPSWLYSVEQGATTIWERLNSYTHKDGFGGNNQMNSFNHYSFGSVAAWMYNYSLGIARDENNPGFKHFILKPEPDPTGRMTSAEGYYDSMYGRIESSWQSQGDSYLYRFVVPANSSATLYLKASSVNDIKDGKKPLAKSTGVKYLRTEANLHSFELSAGVYQIEVDCDVKRENNDRNQRQDFSVNTITEKGAWCWFADPRAIFYENGSGTIKSTYIGYIDVQGNIKATQINHLTNKSSEVLIRSWFQPDDHNNPTFLILPDERVMIFYSRHTDEPCFYYRISRKPGDITTLGKEIRLETANNTTYPSPFILSDDPDHIYLCWRGIGWHPTIARLTIPDKEDNVCFDWGPFQILQSQQGGRGVRPYAKYMSNGKDKIYLAYTTTHPDNQSVNYIYLNYIDINSHDLKDITGEKLAEVGSGVLHDVEATVEYKKSYLDAVAEDSPYRNWLWEISIADEDKPVIAVVRISEDKNSHEYYHVRWTGKEWQKTFLSYAGGHFHQTPGLELCYSGGMAIDKANPSIIYGSVPVEGKHGRVYELKKFTVTPEGTLVSSEQLTFDSPKNNIRPFVISNQGENPQMVWMQGDYYDWIVSSARPGYPTAIRTNMDIPSDRISPDKGLLYQSPEGIISPEDLKVINPVKSDKFTIVATIAIDHDACCGEIIKTEGFTYGIKEGEQPKPYIKVGNREIISTNVLGNSDSWKSEERGTTGRWFAPMKPDKFQLAISYENGVLKTYIDGLIDQYIEVEGLSLSKLSPAGFKGTIGSVRIYNRVLSQDEIKKLELMDDTDWPQITNENKPWTRWWWMGSDVDSANLAYNLAALSKGGIGGVEITPIYGVKGREGHYLDYLSPQWMDMLGFTISEANRLGMGVDMNNGTGWPFGGPEVSLQDAATKAIFREYVLEGGEQLNELVTVRDEREKEFVRLHKLIAYSRDGEITDITDRVSPEGKLDWTAPQGKDHTLIALFIGKTRQQVKRAAPGGEGYVLNHLDKGAVMRYFGKFDTTFVENNTPFPSTFFNDSYEVYGADWTPDLLDQFEKRRGYKLQDYFPELLANGKTDISARVITDYRETIGELLKENFTILWTEWAHSHGVKTRNQAHGSPANLLDLYAAVDIPECESFGITDFNIPGLRKDPIRKENDSDPTILKYASSAAHVDGKTYTSSETFTWLTEHFKTSLSQAKPEIDQMFTSGVNRVYFHGTTYSPKDVDWPGWKFYASVDMSPTNSIWKDASAFFDYIARVQSFLQSGKPDNDFLLYLPLYDIWNEQRDGYYTTFAIHGLRERIPHFCEAVEKIIECGYDLDYISDHFIGTTTVENGLLKTEGGTTYKALILPAVKYIPANTMERIIKLTQQGGTVIFVEHFPSDVPGLSRLEERREQFNTLLSQLAQVHSFENISVHPLEKGTVISGTDYRELLTKWKDHQETFVSEQGGQLIRRSYKNGHIYFFSMLQNNTVDGWVTLGVKAGSALFFDPMTGKKGWAAIREHNGRTQVYMQLKPGESLILKTFSGKNTATSEWPYYQLTGRQIELNNGWELSFEESEPAVAEEFHLESLFSWTDLDNELLKKNMGTGHYRLTFDFTKEPGHEYMISLGDVRESALLRVNGKDVGTLFAVPFKTLIGPFLHNGHNIIEIDVTNLPANRIADYDRRSVQWRIFHEINFVDITYKPNLFDRWETVPSGLLGPVIIRELGPIEIIQ